jgi:anti-anti-sigma factor
MPWTTITTNVRDDVVFLEPGGTFSLGGTEDGLPPVVTQWLERGYVKQLLNLHHVPYIDSVGLGGIIRAHQAVRRRGGKLKIFNVVPRVQHLLDVTKLTPVLDIFDSEESAIKSFDGGVSAASASLP